MKICTAGYYIFDVSVLHNINVGFSGSFNNIVSYIS
jgi:hypothetical protein